MAPPLGEPSTGCHDNRRRLEGSWEWGYGGVGWGRGAVQIGNCTLGRLLHRFPPALSFLGNFPSPHTPPPHSPASLPCSPSPGALLAATLAHPLRPSSSMFLTSQQMDAFAAPTAWLPQGSPSRTCIPTLSPFCHHQPPPVCIPAPRRIPTCSMSRPAPDPYAPPPLSLDPTLTHTDADQCIHDGSESLHIFLALSHGPTMPTRPRVPDPGCGCEPRA